MFSCHAGFVRSTKNHWKTRPETGPRTFVLRREITMNYFFQGKGKSKKKKKPSMKAILVHILCKCMVYMFADNVQTY